jgi:PEGA domain
MSRRTLGAVVLAASLVAAPAHAQRGPKPRPAAVPAPRTLAQSLTGDAKAAYDAGKVLAADGDFAGALIKFKAAFDASKDPRVLWNVAFCEKNLRHYSKVITTLQRYQADGGALLTDKDRKDAQDLITTIEPFTTKMTIHVNEDGAQIFVDDEPVGTSPLASPVVLDIGERHVRVTKDGFTPFEKTTPVGGSAAVALDVTMQKVVHQGRLVVNAPPGSTIFLDEQQVGTGKLDQAVPTGGHQLRVTAPGMRPFQSEVVVQDNETRSVDVVLERQAEPEKPKIRVAVGCDDGEPKSPDDGVVVYLDGPDVAPAVNVKRHWSDDVGRNVVDYIEYSATAGPHRVRVRIPGCDSLEVSVDVDAAKGADVSGALYSDTFVLFRGPQGTPGHLRVGVGAWLYAGPATDKMPEEYGAGLGAVKGIDLNAALAWRWFGMSLDGAYGSGSFHRQSFSTNYALPDPATTNVWMGVLRAGPRIPFNVVALAFGAEVGIQEINVAQVRTGNIGPVVGGWGAIDIQPLCDWGVSVSGSGGGSNDNGFGTFQVGVFFAPNAQCRRSRATEHGLRPAAR